MKKWKDYIETLKEKYIGKKVKYEGAVYTIVDVDYNAIIHIDKPSQYNATTAVYTTYEADKNLI